MITCLFGSLFMSPVLLTYVWNGMHTFFCYSYTFLRNVVNGNLCTFDFGIPNDEV